MYEYERKLIDYLPHVLRDVREFKAILDDGEENEIFLLWASVDNALKDQFIKDATENGISRWEKLLGITPKATFTLDERKFTILTKINEQLPFTLTTLNEQLKGLCGEDGYSVKIDYNNYIVAVQIALEKRNNYNDVEALLNRIIPANMVIELSLKYNQYKNYNYANRHYTMAGFTHYELRNMAEGIVEPPLDM